MESLGSGPACGQKYMANRIADRVMYLEQRMNAFAMALEQTQATSADKSLSNPGQVYPAERVRLGAGHQCSVY